MHGCVSTCFKGTGVREKSAPREVHQREGQFLLVLIWTTSKVVKERKSGVTAEVLQSADEAALRS